LHVVDVLGAQHWQVRHNARQVAVLALAQLVAVQAAAQQAGVVKDLCHLQYKIERFRSTRHARVSFKTQWLPQVVAFQAAAEQPGVVKDLTHLQNHATINQR
jgi:hypothetical protein